VTQTSVPQEVRELVERFDRNRDAYRSPSYDETQLRREFLDPFFAVLGWDVDNRAGWAEAYKEVIHEDAIKIGGFTKAPDYCFRVFLLGAYQLLFDWHRDWYVNHGKEKYATF